MLRTNAENLLRELSVRLGGPEIKLDPEGAARLAIEDQPLLIFLFEEAETLAVLAALGPLPDRPAARGRLMRELMLAHCQGRETEGGSFGLEDETGLVFLQRRWFLNPPPEPKEFLTGLARQLCLAQSWRENFQAAGAEDDYLSAYALKV